MKAYAVFTAIGFDRSGLVDEFTDYLARRGINIESSRMAALAGEFAMILYVAGEEEALKPVMEDPSEIAKRTELTVFVREADPPGSRQVEAALPYTVSASGMDHPGIVHRISRLLHEFGVNIEEMDTRVEPAPVSGSPVFIMEAELLVPASVRRRRLRAALQELEDELSVDIEFEAEK